MVRPKKAEKSLVDRMLFRYATFPNAKSVTAPIASPLPSATSPVVTGSHGASRRGARVIVVIVRAGRSV